MNYDTLFDLYGFILNEEFGKVFFDDDGDGEGNDGGGDGEGEKKTYSEDEFNQAKKRRDNALKRARNAEKKVQDLEEKYADLPSKDEHSALQGAYDELKVRLEELEEHNKEEELKKIKDEKERERARANRDFEKQREALQSKIEDMQKKIESFDEETKKHAEVLSRYRKRGLEADIISSATKAFNPKQIVKLLVDDFIYDDASEEWVYEIRDGRGNIKEIMSVGERVEAFLTDPDNENLLQAPVRSGSGANRGSDGASGDDDDDTTKEATEAMYEWARREGLDINNKSSSERKKWLVKTYKGLHTTKARKAGE